MENKESKEEEEEKQEIRMMTLSSSFSKNRYIFYHCLRVVNSILITSTALWYSHYYLIRTDDDKSYSYFSKKPKNPTNPNPSPSKQRKFCDKITQCSLIFCALTNLISKLKKRSLTKLLINIKTSHFKSYKQSQKGAIYVKQSDLKLLNKWKCLLGGNKYYFGSLDSSILIMLYTSLISETTLFAFNKQAALSLTSQSDSSQSDWKNRYFQFDQDTQEIEWLDQTQKQAQISDKPSLYSSTYAVVTQYIALFTVPSFILSYSFFPISTLCALNVFKCGLSVEHRQECNTLVWWNKRLCFIAIAKHIFMAIINKLHFLRYFAIREVSIATYKKNIIFGSGSKLKKKKNSKNKLERRLKNLLALRSFTYDIVQIFPWICLYLSCVSTQSSTYYIKTFASHSWFYSSLSKAKHNKNKYLLKFTSVASLIIGVCVAIGNESYFESVKYAKKWFMSVDQYSIESFQSKKKAKEILEQDVIDKSDVLTPGNSGMKDKEDVSYQIEGGEGYKITPKYSVLQEKLINGNYQQDSEMLLSKRYFQQKAHDLFEYITEICVFLEDKFLNSLIVPVY